MTVAWSDSNIGDGTAAGAWSDRVTIINTTTGQTVVDTTINCASQNIAAGSSIIRSTQVVLPAGTAGIGALQISVTVDSTNQIAEFNNGLASRI